MISVFQVESSRTNDDAAFDRGCWFSHHALMGQKEVSMRSQVRKRLRPFLSAALSLLGILTACPGVAQVQMIGGKALLESLGDLPGPRWLDGRTTNGTVGLAPTFGRPFSGTTWLIAPVTGDLFSLQTLGDIEGPRWLSCRVNDNTVVLSPNPTPTSSVETRWRLVSLDGDAVGLHCGNDQSARWLDGRTQTGEVGLAPSTSPPFTGARWRMHSVLPADVLTQRYNSFRTGANLAETVLTPNLLRAHRFGKLFMRTVEGQIYAQPLYAADLTLPGKGPHNVVFVATTANRVYAFDADDPAQGGPLWQSDVLGTPVPRSDIVPETLVEPLIGIVSTPVIDLPTNTIYVVAKSKTEADAVQAAELRDGDAVSLQTLGTIPGPTWLNAITGSNTIALAPSFGGDLSGTWWQMARPGAGDTIFFKTLAFGVSQPPPPPNVWLDGRTADGTVGLAPSTAPPFTGTAWQVQAMTGGGFSLQTLGNIPGPRFLDGRTADATVGLAPSTAPPFSGTRWRIRVHTYHNILYALDLLTGRIRRQVEIEGSTPGTPFFSKWQLNRPGLLLLDGRIYVAFASHADHNPFNGWIFAYGASDLQFRDVFVTTPKGNGAAIWQSGTGLTADEQGHVYAMTGNGTPAAGSTDFTNSFIKLRADDAQRTLQVDGAFHSAGSQGFDLNVCDLDLSSSGPVHLPGAGLVIGAGKEGTLYSLDESNMEVAIQVFNVAKDQFDPASPVCKQWGDVETWPHVHGSPVVWSMQDGSMLMYVWPEKDYLKGFKFDRRHFNTSPFAASIDRAPAMSMPGGTLAITAYGSKPDTGIIWGTRPSDCPPDENPSEIMDQRSCNAQYHIVPGILKAFDARTLEELWSSSAPADALGTLAKFNPPTVAHGRVYVGTFGKNCTIAQCSSDLVVYGVRPGS